MDAPSNRSSPSLPGSGAALEKNFLLPPYEPGNDATSLWLMEDGGCSGGSSDETTGFMASLESGGALMSAGGGWSLSTLPGEEGLRWSGVKTEEVFDEWAASGSGRHHAALMQPSPLLATAATAGGEGGTGIARTVVDLAKSDTEEGWKNFMGQAPTPPPVSSGKKRVQSGEMESPSHQQKQPAPASGISKLPATRPITNRFAGLSANDNIAAFVRQRSSHGATQDIKCATTKLVASRPPATNAAPPPQSRAATNTRAAAAAATKTAAAARRVAAVAGGKANGPIKAEWEDVDVAGEKEHDGDNAPAAGKCSRRTTKTRRARGDSDDEDDLDADEDEGDSAETELTDKRRRNREHAKRSRLRKRVRLGGLEEMVLGLRRENVRLRQIVMRGIPDRAGAIIRACAKDNINADFVAKKDVLHGMRPGMSMGSCSSSWSVRGGTRTRPKLEGGSSSGGGGGGGSGAYNDRYVPSALKLMSPCYQTVKALGESQSNFILTNPNLTDCPIIFASQGFLELTGYDGKDVIGRNCRLLQGPGTDPTTLSILRHNVAAGLDTSVCILNYKKDKTPFWNQLSIGVLLDAHGQVANHVGVMCEVNEMTPVVFHRLLHRVPLPESLLHDDSGSDGDEDEYHYECSAVAVGSSARSSSSGPKARSSSSSASGDVQNTAAVAAAGSPKVVDRLRRTRAASAVRNNVSASP